MKNRKIKGLTQRRQDAKHFKQSHLLVILCVLCGVFTFSFFVQDVFAIDFSSKKEDVEKDDTPWEITADSLSYNDKEGTYHAEKNVVIKKARQALYTQSAVFNTKTGIATVAGGVRIETDGDVITGKEGTFNLNTQTGEIIDGRLFMKANHYYLSGSRMRKTGENTYLVNDCTITTCDGANPDWTITGSEVKVTIEGYGTVKNSAFRIRDLPIIYIPYMFFPAKTKRQSGLLPPKLGYSTLNGAEIMIPFYWAISDQTDATFYQRYMSKRGYMQGAEFRYIEGRNSKGILEFDILEDKETPKNLSDGDAVDISPYARTNQTRYWLRGRADQDLPRGVVARLDGDFVSDQDYLREFEEKLFGFEVRSNLQEESKRPVQEKRSPTRRSALRLSRDGESFTLQGIASYYQQVEDPETKNRVEQPVGGLNFDLLQQQLMAWPVFFNLKTDYDYIWSDEANRGHGITLSPQLNFPFWLGPYVEFEPSLRYTFNSQWVDNNEGDKNNQYQTLYEASARLGTNAEKFFDTSWGNATKLRHKISPTIYYTYQGYNNDDEETPWYSPIDQDDYGTPWYLTSSQAEKNQDRNRVTFSLENFLDAKMEDKEGNVSYNQWAIFRLNQGYEIQKAKEDGENEPFTPLTAELILTPFPSLDLRGSTGWDYYQNTFTETTLSGELTVSRTGGRRDYYEINYQHYVYEEETNQTNINFRTNINLAYGFSVGGSLQRDLEVEKNISSAGWVGYQGQCWGVRLGAGSESGDTTFIVAVRLVGLGSAGSW
ncbi:MAG: LPS assembly protein LptD [Deltaproteobacteria bacterium]|nr:LPS assembly protein LptD [Deltaproteobacteria bacterium]